MNFNISTTQICLSLLLALSLNANAQTCVDSGDPEVDAVIGCEGSLTKLEAAKGLTANTAADDEKEEFRPLGLFRFYMSVRSQLRDAKDSLVEFTGKTVESESAPKQDTKNKLTVAQIIQREGRDSLRQDINLGKTEFPTLVKVVANPHEGILAKLMMIEQAKETIDAVYYIYKMDLSGSAFLAKLEQAVQRGVRVRLLIDASGSMSLRNSKLKALEDFARKHGEKNNVTIAVFNPLTGFIKNVGKNTLRRMLNLFSSDKKDLDIIKANLNRRTHDKILLIDAHTPNSIMMIGGRNIADHYYAVGADKNDTYNDMEIIVKNKMPDGRTYSDQMTFGDKAGKYFDRLFNHLGNKELHLGIMGTLFGTYRRAQKEIDKKATEFSIDPELKTKLENMQKNDYLNTGFVEGETKLASEASNILRNDPSLILASDEYINEKNKIDLKNDGQITVLLREKMKAAKRNIRIVSPYIYMTPEEIDSMVAWLKQPTGEKDSNGQEIKKTLEVVTNSIMTSDNMLAQIIVDNETLRNLLDKATKQGVSEQITLLELGKEDAIELGGKVAYGKLHAKYITIDNETLGIGTFNGDPRSRALNSEVAVFVKSPKATAVLNESFNELMKMSHEYDSPEWKKIREDRKLGTYKHYFVKRGDKFLKWLERLNLTFLI